MIEKYSDCVEFLFVYTGEAGMSPLGPLHQLPAALRPFAEPPGTPRGSRIHLASRVRAGKEHFGLCLLCLLDNEQGVAQKLYNACPKRLLIVDLAGRIVLDSGHRPAFAFPWKEATDWLDHYSESIDPLYEEKRGS
ncbi:MAG TPA: hypothetical protein VMF69_08950 [Gemmataceae bacterium]|nr:hypothetical protein [Gemmataceae bacterium]